MKNLLGWSTFLFGPLAHACPFCDLGGTATAVFIVTFLGFICLGMLAFFFAFHRSGGMQKSDAVAYKVFEAEKMQIFEENQS